MNHTLDCEINQQVGGDHAYCNCDCHKSAPATPPSRRRVVSFKGDYIKEKLMNMRMVLGNSTNNFETDYHVSVNGVPYVHVMINKARFQFVYFGHENKFRVFFPDHIRHQDFLTSDEVSDFFRSLRMVRKVE